MDANTLAGSALAGRFKLDGENALAGDFRSGAPAGKFDALRLPGVALTLKGRTGARAVDGRIEADVLLALGKKAADFERLALRADVTDPGLQPLKLSLDGKAEVDAKAARWNLTGALNANRFESSGRAAFGGARPDIQADARFDSLDLNQLLAPDKPAKAPAPAAAAPADTPVRLDGLKAVDGRFKLAAGTLVFRQYRVAAAGVDATLGNGLLRIERLAGRAWGGSVQASGTAEAGSQRIAVKLLADGVDVNALLKDVAGKDLLEGTGRVTADLATRGASLGALRSALGGSAALRVRDGAVKGINLARALRQAKASLTLKQDALTQANSNEKTDFTELTASARIADGVAHSDDLDLKSPFLRVGGAGRFDIGRGRIDYVARATVTDTAAGQGGSELAALRGITVPVALTGPFESIDWKIQWSGVAAQAIEKQLKDKLMDRLGAELGRRGGTPPATPSPSPAIRHRRRTCCATSSRGCSARRAAALRISPLKRRPRARSLAGLMSTPPLLLPRPPARPRSSPASACTRTGCARPAACTSTTTTRSGAGR